MSSSTISSRIKTARNNFIKFYNEYSPKRIRGEQTVYYNEGGLRYAGTLDWYGTVTDGGIGKLVILDWKTTDKPNKIGYKLQLEAYFRAAGLPAEELWIVGLPKERDIDFKKDIVKLVPCQKRFVAFINALHLYNYLKENK